MNNRGLLVVISGFSGAGKSQLTKLLIASHDNYAYSVSATTRKPRAGETDGKDYFFLAKEEFEKMISEGKLLEYNCYVGNYYGTPKDYVLGKMAEGKDVILEIDVNGAENVKKAFPDAVTVFVTAPDAKELEKRLTGRGTESEEVVRKRLTEALHEAPRVKNYDYLVINDDLSETASRLHRLISDQHMRTAQMAGYIEDFTREMADILAVSGKKE